MTEAEYDKRTKHLNRSIAALKGNVKKAGTLAEKLVAIEKVKVQREVLRNHLLYVWEIITE